MTAGHERKHNACRADVGGSVNSYTYISRVKSPQVVCQGSVEECNQAHAGTCPQNQTALSRTMHVHVLRHLHSCLLQ